MCAIIDANVVRGVFQSVGGAAGFFMEQVDRRMIVIVVGGEKLRVEYEKAGMASWLAEATNAGIVRREESDKVDARAAELERQRKSTPTRIRSDDYHILALAQISGARLLYSSDRDLHADFTNKEVIEKPRGKVYSTSVNEDLADKHRRLIRQASCPL